jgi:CBS domain containing-hemolysin-like protein
MLSGAQLGITVTGLIVGFIAEPAIGALVRPLLPGLGIPEAAIAGVSLAAGMIAATLIQMVLGELFPKNYGIARPETVAKALAGSTLVYLKVAGPVIRFFDASATRLVRLFGVEPVEELHEGAGPEELGRIIDESEEAGDLTPRLAGLLDRAMDFDERIADDVMVPRPRVTGVRADATARQALAVLREAGVTRCPVFASGGVDDLVGLLSVRELIADPELDFDTATAGQLARPALLVPDSLPVPALLARMRAEDAEMACVIDEFGGLDGIVTVEDIAEELVGEIADESDEPEEPIVAESDGSWLLDGGLRLDEVERICGIELPEGDYETLGGLVMTRLGRLPEVGEAAEVVLVPPAPLEGEPPPALRVRLEVVRLERRVPAEVRLSTEAVAREEFGDEQTGPGHGHGHGHGNGHGHGDDGEGRR